MTIIESPPVAHPVVGFAARLRVLAAGDRTDIAAESAATSTAAWVAQATRQSRTTTTRDVRLALALDEDFPATRAALATGWVDVEQARVIVRAVQSPPSSVSATDRSRAERQLLHDAGEHDAVALRLLGHRVFEVLDGVEAGLGRRLEAEERASARSTYLEIFDNGDGTHAGRFKISTFHAAMLRRAPVGPPGAARPGVRRAARADPGAPPVDLGRPERHRRGAAGLRHAALRSRHRHPRQGEVISAGLARRMARESGIVPAVFGKVIGGPSVVLDLGEARFHSRHQRLALTLRDRTCTAEACDRPAGWCHAHHEVPWHQGGPTSLANGRLLCPFHDGKAHSPGYEMTHLPHWPGAAPPPRVRRWPAFRGALPATAEAAAAVAAGAAAGSGEVPGLRGGATPQRCRSLGNGRRGTPPSRRWKRTRSA